MSKLIKGKIEAIVKTSIKAIIDTNTNNLLPVFVHSHHVHQHQINDKFGIRKPIHIEHIVCF